MASTEWPKAMSMPRMPNFLAKSVASHVCLRKPSDSSRNFKLPGVGKGTTWYPDFSSVIADQSSSITTITVVICITRKAFSLDS